MLSRSDAETDAEPMPQHLRIQCCSRFDAETDADSMPQHLSIQSCSRFDAETDANSMPQHPATVKLEDAAGAFVFEPTAAFPPAMCMRLAGRLFHLTGLQCHFSFRQLQPHCFHGLGLVQRWCSC